MKSVDSISRDLEQIADGLDESCLIIDEFGQKTKNVMFKFPAVISRIDDVKDAELYDIDTEKILFILDVELKDVLTKLLHYSPGNGQKLEREFEPIKKWAISLDLSTPRPSKIRFPRMADYPDLVIENISRLMFHLPERANELRRVSKLLKESEKSAETEQKACSPLKKIIGWIFKKTSHFIFAIVVAVIATIIAAIIVDILADFGWIQRIKDLFTK